MVRGLSDSLVADPSQKEEWPIRKRAYIVSLDSATDEVLLVSAADKLANARSMAKDFADIGAALWQKFRTGNAKDQFWYYGELIKVFEQRRVAPTMVAELKKIIDALRDDNPNPEETREEPTVR